MGLKAIWYMTLTEKNILEDFIQCIFHGLCTEKNWLPQTPPDANMI